MNVDRMLNIVSLILSTLGLVWGIFTYVKDKGKGCNPAISISKKETVKYYRYTYYKVSTSNTTNSSTGWESIFGVVLVGMLCCYIYTNYLPMITIALCSIGVICNSLIYLLVLGNVNGYGLKVYHLIPTQICYICLFIAIYFFVNPYFMPLEEANSILEFEKTVPYVLLIFGAILIIAGFVMPIFEIVRDLFLKQKGYVKYKPYSWAYAILLSIIILAFTSGLCWKILKTFEKNIKAFLETL